MATRGGHDTLAKLEQWRVLSQALVDASLEIRHPSRHRILHGEFQGVPVEPAEGVEFGAETGVDGWIVQDGEYNALRGGGCGICTTGTGFTIRKGGNGGFERAHSMMIISLSA